MHRRLALEDQAVQLATDMAARGGAVSPPTLHLQVFACETEGQPVQPATDTVAAASAFIGPVESREVLAVRAACASFREEDDMLTEGHGASGLSDAAVAARTFSALVAARIQRRHEDIAAATTPSNDDNIDDTQNDEAENVEAAVAAMDSTLNMELKPPEL